MFGVEVEDALLRDAGLATVVGIVGFAVCYAAIALAGVTIYDSKKGTVQAEPSLANKLDAADGVFCQPFFMLLVYLALKATWDLSGSLGDRWHTVTFESRWFQICYVTRMATHIPIQWVTLANNPALRLQMTAHHVLSAACMGFGLLTGRMHFFAVFDGCCEVSTLFLNSLFLFKVFAPPDACGLGKAVSGLLLWASFLVFRLALFPAWLYIMYADSVAEPSRTVALITPFEKFVNPSVTLFLFFLSCAWMVPITKGLVKAVKGVLGGKGVKTD